MQGLRIWTERIYSLVFPAEVPASFFFEDVHFRVTKRVKAVATRRSILRQWLANVFRSFSQDLAHLDQRVLMPNRHILETEPFRRLSVRGLSLSDGIGTGGRLNVTIHIVRFFELGDGVRR